APLWVLPAGYLAATTVGGLSIKGAHGRDRLWLPAILPTMHLSWGWGFLTSPRSLVPGGVVERRDRDDQRDDQHSDGRVDARDDRDDRDRSGGTDAPQQQET